MRDSEEDKETRGQGEKDIVSFPLSRCPVVPLSLLLRVLLRKVFPERIHLIRQEQKGVMQRQILFIVGIVVILIFLAQLVEPGENLLHGYHRTPRRAEFPRKHCPRHDRAPPLAYNHQHIARRRGSSCRVSVRVRLAESGLCDTPLSPETIRWLCGEVTRLCHFFTGPNMRLEGEHQPSEESVWEIFQGRLLDPAYTRQRRTFEAWNIYQLAGEGRSAEPLLSLKWDQDAEQIHVVRGIDSYVWEGYDSGGGVYLSRERRKWVRELVGTIELPRFRDLEELRDELICLLFNAVVGTSRLPLAPVETPLPAFSFGELFYCYRSDEPATSKPLCSWEELVQEMHAGIWLHANR